MATVNSTASSQVAYSYLQSKNKIGGLVSGMDIDSIMEKLMKAESAQMEKLQQQKQKYEWKRDAYREVNTKLNTFQQDLFDKYGLKSSWNSKTATTSTNSAVNVTATANASGNLSITEVKMATSATQTYNAASKASQNISGTTLLENITGSSGDITIFSKQTNATDSNSKLTSVKDVIQELEQNGYTASVSNGALTMTAKSDAKEIDDVTKKGLEQLGMTFSNEKEISSKLVYTDEQNIEKVATTATKLSDLNLNTGTLKIQLDGNDEVEIDLSQTESISDLINELDSKGFNATIMNGQLSISSKDNREINTSIENASTNNVQFGNVLKSNIGKALVEPSSGTDKIKGSNTIQEVLGTSDSGMLTFNAIQSDGKMKATTITYKATDTIDSLMTKINSSGAGVTALFNNGKFSISANNAGKNSEGAEVTFSTNVEDENGSIENVQGKQLLEKLTGKTIGTEDEFELASGGSDASMTINGVKYEQSSNVFNIAGYQITATGNLSDTTVSGATTTAVSISSSNDTDKAIDKVKAFVESYNALIEELNGKTSEKKKVGYDPLTDAQKAEMSESEITKWEEAAKKGLLKGDSTLNSVLSKMRQTLFTYGTSTAANSNGTAVGIKGETLASIGIKTSSTWSDNGKLEIDEDKLRAAIEKDPDILSRIFTGDGTKENPGITSQLRTTAQEAIKTIEKSAGKETSASETSYSIGKSIASLTTKIDDWKDRLKDIEDRYWKQFSAMETAIQKANSQSSIFAQ